MFPVVQFIIHVGDAFKGNEVCMSMDGYKMFYRSTRKVVSSRASLWSQSETHAVCAELES